ncbi:MAG: hypothetical protein ACKODH_05335 [Limisphaerales bacterium]
MSSFRLLSVLSGTTALAGQAAPPLTLAIESENKLLTGGGDARKAFHDEVDRALPILP